MAILWLFSAFLLTAEAHAAKAAKNPVVILGEIEAVPAAKAVRSVFRSAVEQELRATDFGKPRYRRRYVLDISLVKLESASKNRIATSTCVVSAMLRTKDNEIVAVINGRATAEGSQESAANTRREAVRGATRSAVSKIPRALRATESR